MIPQARSPLAARAISPLCMAATQVLEDIMPEGEAKYRASLNLRRALPLYHCPVYTEGKYLGEFWKGTLSTSTAPLDP